MSLHYARTAKLPRQLQEALQRFANHITFLDGAYDAELRHIVHLIEQLPPAMVARFDYEIPLAAGLWRQPVMPAKPHTLMAILRQLFPAEFAPLVERRPFIEQLLREKAGLELLYVFHRDGTLRELALDKWDRGLKSPFYVAVLAYRLNDWVPQVRAAAVRCGERVLPLTAGSVIAEAALVLLDRRTSWQRWRDEATVLDSALSRPDVIDAFADHFLRARHGPMGSLLRRSLRWSTMDRHLEQLSQAAFLPAVRAVALETLIEGTARWPSGWAKEWTDKVYGKFRYVRTFDQRYVGRSAALELLVERAARDPCGAVRKIAATALVRHIGTLANSDLVIELLRHDRSAAIKDSIDYVLRGR